MSRYSEPADRRHSNGYAACRGRPTAYG